MVEDALQDPRFFREVDVLTRFQTRTILGVPLRTKEKSFGVIEAVNKISGKYEDDNVRVLQHLAAQTDDRHRKQPPLSAERPDSRNGA